MKVLRTFVVLKMVEAYVGAVYVAGAPSPITSIPEEVVLLVVSFTPIT